MLTTHGSRIAALAVYRPNRLVSNEELSQRTTVSPEWIESRTGIRTRHHADEQETIAAMAAAAGEKAVVEADIDPAEVDLTIVASATRRVRMPGVAPEVASRIGLPNSGAYDLNAVCAGFTYSLAMASNAVRLGEARHALVIGAERTSEWIDPNDPDSFVIFGDGAGAAVVSRSETAGIGPAVMYHVAAGESVVLRGERDFTIEPSLVGRIGWSQTWSRVGRRLFVYLEPKVRPGLREGADGAMRPVLNPVLALVVGSGKGR